MSFVYTCVYRFDSSSYSNHFSAMLVTIDKTRTFVEALVFFSVRHALWHFVLVCAFTICIKFSSLWIFPDSLRTEIVNIDIDEYVFQVV